MFVKFLKSHAQQSVSTKYVFDNVKKSPFLYIRLKVNLIHWWWLAIGRYGRQNSKMAPKILGPWHTHTFC